MFDKELIKLIGGNRKYVAYTVLLMVLGMLAMALGRARLRRWFVWTLAACALLAVANELHQTLPGGRTCSPVDMLIDTAGALIGALLSAALLHALSSASSRKGNHDDTTGDAI